MLRITFICFGVIIGGLIVAGCGGGDETPPPFTEEETTPTNQIPDTIQEERI